MHEAVARCCMQHGARSRKYTYTQNVHLKKQTFWAKAKIGVFACFSCKTDSFRRPGAFCWPIAVIAALWGHVLPLDDHKLVKKPGNSSPQVLQIVHFSTGRFLFKNRMVWWIFAREDSKISYRWFFLFFLNRPYKNKILHTSFWTQNLGPKLEI